MPQQDFNKMSGQQLARYIFECTMSVLYVVFAVLFLFTDWFLDTVQGNLRIGLGILFGVYGIFRVYRALKKMLSPKE